MKNYYLLPVLLILIGCSSGDDEETVNKTYVPDDIFEETLIYKGLDDKMDNYVLTENITEIDFFGFQFDDGIQNLIGLEDFINLEYIEIYGGSIKSVDLSNNEKLINVTIQSNLEEIDLPQNSKLERLNLWGNNLEEINISDSKELISLDLRKNRLSRLDVSNNNLLDQLLTQGNLLNCIKVSQEQVDDIPQGWSKDDTTSYTVQCE